MLDVASCAAPHLVAMANAAVGVVGVNRVAVAAAVCGRVANRASLGRQLIPEELHHLCDPPALDALHVQNLRHDPRLQICVADHLEARGLGSVAQNLVEATGTRPVEVALRCIRRMDAVDDDAFFIIAIAAVPSGIAVEETGLCTIALDVVNQEMVFAK